MTKPEVTRRLEVLARITYFDALLQDHENRVAKGLPPSTEYQRLSDEAARGPLLVDGLCAVTQEVNDFMEAFDRALAKRNLIS
jgi:hypothetical protein